MPHMKLEAIEHKRSLTKSRNALSDGGAARAVIDGAVDGDESVERYLDHLAQLDMPLAMKIELIRALRGIMQSFVDRAFGDDPVQLTIRSDAIRNKDDENVAHGVLVSGQNISDDENIKQLGLSGKWREKAKDR